MSKPKLTHQKFIEMAEAAGCDEQGIISYYDTLPGYTNRHKKRTVANFTGSIKFLQEGIWKIRNMVFLKVHFKEGEARYEVYFGSYHNIPWVTDVNFLRENADLFKRVADLVEEVNAWE